MNNITRISTPSATVVDLALAKTNGRISTDADDTFIEHLSRAAQAVVEGPDGIGVALLTGEWLQHETTHQRGSIRLPFGPVQAVTKVETRLNGVWSLVDPASYIETVGIRPAMVVPASSWPEHDQIRITFKAGYGDTAAHVPSDLVHAILLLIAHWYDNRDLFANGQTEAPMGVTSMLNRYR